MTVQIIEFHGDEKRYVDALLKAQQRTQELEAELKKAGKASQDAAGAVGDAFKQTEQEQARVMNALRTQLRAIGPEGLAAAKAMSESMATGGRESEVAVNELLDKIKLIDPVAAEAARAGFQTAKDEMAEASRFGEGAFQKPLDKLRAMGPEGRKAAELLKASLVEAGKISERSMADVIEEIRKIDPAAAEAAQKIQGELEKSADESADAWDVFGKRAVTAVTTLAGTYLSFSSTVQLVNRFLEEQVRLQEQAKDVQISFGAAQQSTLSNLAGMSKGDQDFLVGQAIDQISTQAKFGDRTAIIQAIGAVASAGVEDKDKIVQIVTAAAKSTNLNPGQLKGNAVAGAAIMQQAGLADINEALALATTAGPLSKIEDLSRLARVLPVALSAVGATTQGLSPQQAAKEGTSMFSIVGQAAQDELGESTRTFMVGFSTKLNTFFTEMKESRAKAMDEVASIEERMGKGKETETDKLTLPKLKAFLTESANLTDSGGLISRVEQLQQLPAVAALFREKTTVEQQFQPSLKRLLDASDPLLGEIKAGVGKLSTDAAMYEAHASRMQSATSQTTLGTTQSQSTANLSNFEQSVGPGENARIAMVREIMTKTGETIRSSLKSGEAFPAWMEDTKNSWFKADDSASQMAGNLLIKFASDNQKEAIDGLTPSEKARTALRTQQMQILMRDFIANATPEEAKEIMRQVQVATGEGQSILGAPSRIQFAADLERENSLIEMMTVLKQIAANTGATAGNTLPGDQPSSLPPLSTPP